MLSTLVSASRTTLSPVASLCASYHQMRRKDRQVNDKSEICKILDSCQFATIGLSVNDEPYTVPISFGYEWDENPVFYFHSATEGRKIDSLRQNPKTCISLVGSSQAIYPEPGNLCSASNSFKSVTAEGKCVFIEDVEEKTKGFNAMMKHYNFPTGKFNPNMMKKTKVIKFIPDDLKCKIHE